MLHVQPDASKSKERAFLLVFNQDPHNAVNTTIQVPLYHSGLSTTAAVSHEGGPATSMSLARDWTVGVPLSMEPHSFTWFVFE